MVTKANRDVLCFEETVNRNIKNLPIKRDAPLYKTKSQSRGCPYLLFAKGALTVEAAFCTIFFFLAFVALLYLFQILAKQNRIQMCLADAVSKYETYGTKLGTIEGVIKEDVMLHWSESEGICYVKQEHDIPFLPGQWFTVSLYQQMRIHSYEGKSMIPPKGKSEEYVYIAENGRVYHRQESCVYLKPTIRNTSYADIFKERNSSGGIYSVCKRCCRNVDFAKSDIVYYTPYGESFHSDAKCSGLKRTVRRVGLSTIGKMPPCSKCGG